MGCQQFGLERFFSMSVEVFQGVLIPFLGTTLGSASVFLMRRSLSAQLQRILTGFAAGVMMAASVWSLLIPALEESESLGVWGFLPAAGGFLIGIAFLLLLDHTVPHLHIGSDTPEGHASPTLHKTSMMVLAVVLHNIPEGMAVGILLAGWQNGQVGISLSAALALSIGIAIQNFPEGAIISLPLRAEGLSKGKSFWYGLLSGAVEPVAAGITILASHLILPVLPWLLSAAAGAMIYVVVEELIPEASLGEHSNTGTIAFAAGFVLMMILDVALG